LRRKGIGTIYIDGELNDIGENLTLNEEEDYQIEAIVDKFAISSDQHQSLLDGVKECQRIGEGFIKIKILSESINDVEKQQFYADFACPTHSIVMAELLPWYFSPNEGDSACLTCGGLGVYRKAVPYLMVDNENHSILKGAINERLFNITISKSKKIVSPSVKIDSKSNFGHHFSKPDFMSIILIPSIIPVGSSV